MGSELAWTRSTFGRGVGEGTSGGALALTGPPKEIYIKKGRIALNLLSIG